MDVSEKNLEETIEAALLGAPGAGAKNKIIYEPAPGGVSQAGGYHKRHTMEYDRKLCLIPRDMLDFIKATQPKEWRKFRAQFGDDENEASERFFQRLVKEIGDRGTLEMLRSGMRANGCKFDLAYFRPTNRLNPDTQKRYEANIFSIVRQLHYSEKNENSLDIAIFLNGLPIFTAELKNQLTGQSAYKNGIRQYKEDRDQREPLFAFGRCLAHFAVDPETVYVTTHLQGRDTVFLPFNRGRDGGAGNPITYRGFACAYLWEQIWSRDSILNLIQHFIQVIQEENEKGRKTNKRRLIFPRYHQLDCVRRLVADAREKGAGQRYLIQHSAGSGKSNSIAWLAHQLSTLFDENDQRIFHSVIVITDRRVLDRQLQRTVRQFEQTRGIVENIDTTSKKLKTALKEGRTIIVTTLQKFPFIVDDMKELSGTRFAVIIDEAHSSQSGSRTDSLKQVLSASDAEQDEEEEEDIQDRIVKAVKAHGLLSNVSYFAFTATPKQKTLELFGRKRPDGEYEAFSLYTMRQAIEEGFILDVLENYTTIKAYWNLLKKVEDDPHCERARTAAVLRAFVDLHPETIAQKVAIIVEHFATQSAPRIGGKAKAMIVASSRKQAVRYKQALDKYLQEHGYPYKALVAFSGTVHDGGIDYTEADMNGLSESQTAEAFKQDQYRFLIVANKFQTGFDQPLLHTMYVDKKLGGVNAVQTLSRLNRIHPEKHETMVLDFANRAEDIQAAFAPFYEKTILSEGTDPNLLYDLQTRLANFDFYSEAEIDQFAEVYFDPRTTADRLHAVLDVVVARYKEATAQEQADFRGQLTDYMRLYSFLAQIITFVDVDLEKLYVFSKYLLKKLPTPDGRYPLEVQQFIDIESYRLVETSKGKITLPRHSGEIEPMRAKRTYMPVEDEIEPLSQIIQELNQHFGADFTAEDTTCIMELERRLAEDVAVEGSVRVSSRENARLTFDDKVRALLEDMMEGHFKFYKHVIDDERFANFFIDWLFERYLKKVKRPA